METIQVRKGTTQRMKSKDKRDEILQVRVSPIQSHPENPSANDKPSHEEIRLRAYEIYLERGGLPGNEIDDWHRAERELEKVSLFARDWDRIQQRVAPAPKAQIDIRPMETKEKWNQ